MGAQRSIQIIHATAGSPGAIAIVQLLGDSLAILQRLTGETHWPIGRMRLVRIADIDEGLVVRLTDHVAHLMPHGGPRVVQRLTSRLREWGACLADDEVVPSQMLFPEAEDEIESLALLAMAKASSPTAIDALLAQVDRWRNLKASGGSLTEADLEANTVLGRLITPPVVVVIGSPNVGKSTLSNALLGRTISIASPEAGTTRDYVAGRIDLAGLVVDWHDTPGFRADAGVIERRAVDISMALIERADMLVAMRDHAHDWPELPRAPDLFLLNKVDELDECGALGTGYSSDSPLRMSAKHAKGLVAFAQIVRERLVPSSVLAHEGVWVFDERLISICSPQRF